MVTWQKFLELNCTFEHGQMDRAYLVKFWFKFFDPKLKGVCQEAVYMEILESLIRGKAMQTRNDCTALFAEKYRKWLVKAGCLGPANEIIISRYGYALDNGLIDVAILCQALCKS